MATRYKSRTSEDPFEATIPASQRAGIDEMQNRDSDAARKARIAAMERKMTEDANRRHGGGWIGKQLNKVSWGTIGDRVSNYFNGDTPPSEVGLDDPAVAPLDAQPSQGAFQAPESEVWNDTPMGGPTDNESFVTPEFKSLYNGDMRPGEVGLNPPPSEPVGPNQPVQYPSNLGGLDLSNPSNQFYNQQPPSEPVGLNPAVAPPVAVQPQGAFQAPESELWDDSPIDPSMGNAVPEEVGLDPQGNNLQDDPATMGAIKDLKVPEVGLKKYKTINDIGPGDEEYDSLNQYQRDDIDKDRRLLSSLQTKMGYEASRLNGVGVTGKRAREAYAALSAQYNQARANITQKLNSFGIRTEAADVRKQLLTADMNKPKIDAYADIGVARATGQATIEVAKEGTKQAVERTKAGEAKDLRLKEDAKVSQDRLAAVLLDQDISDANNEMTSIKMEAKNAEDAMAVERLYDKTRTTLIDKFRDADISMDTKVRDLKALCAAADVSPEIVDNRITQGTDAETREFDWGGKNADMLSKAISLGLVRQMNKGGGMADQARQGMNHFLDMEIDENAEKSEKTISAGEEAATMDEIKVKDKYIKVPKIPVFNKEVAGFWAGTVQLLRDVVTTNIFRQKIKDFSTDSIKSLANRVRILSHGQSAEALYEITNTAYKQGILTARAKMLRNDPKAKKDYTAMVDEYNKIGSEIDGLSERGEMNDNDSIAAVLGTIHTSVHSEVADTAATYSMQSETE